MSCIEAKYDLILPLFEVLILLEKAKENGKKKGFFLSILDQTQVKNRLSRKHNCHLFTNRQVLHYLLEVTK